MNIWKSYLKDLFAAVDKLNDVLLDADLTEPLTAEAAYKLGIVIGKCLSLKEATDAEVQ